MPAVSHLPRLDTLTAQNIQAKLAHARLGASLTPNDAQWLDDVATQFGSDPTVKAALNHMLDGVTIADASSVSAAFTAIGRALPSSTPVQSGATNGATTPVGAQAGGVKPQNATSIDVVHFAGPSTYEGDFKFKAGVLDQNYAGVPADQFGTTTIKMPGGASYLVHDMQYDLGDGHVGMRLLPVTDKGGTVVDKDGKTVPGNTVVDNFIREQCGLKPDEPIYALINYIHPETWSGDLQDLAQNKLKTEMASTHLGAYWGNLETTNSPEQYHNHTFEVDEGSTGYPCNVNIVSMDGVPQALLNKNLRLADGMLNHGVEFPPDYKNDVYRTVDLPTTMMFYRDWIEGADYLHNDASWFTYCAEHKTIATNVGLNLPHNLAAFKEMFGDVDGAALWDKFKAKFKANEGRDFTAADETSFEPLWKKEGMKLDDVKPWKDKAEYDAYQAARQAGSLASYTGRVPPEPGKGLAWPPETTSDLISDFITTYANFEQAGGFVAAASMLGFKDQICERMGITADKFLAMTVPVVNKMLVAEAMATAPGQSADAWMKRASATLLAALGGNAQLQPLVDQCLQGAKAQINQIVAMPVPQDAQQARAAAHQWLRDAVQLDVEKARRVAVSDASKVEFNSPPAVVNRVAIGMHESSKFVHIRTICTCVDGAHLEPK